MKRLFSALISFTITVSAAAQTFQPSSLNLEAHETGTGVLTQSKWETGHGSYGRDYRQRKKIVVTIRDLSRKAPPLIAHVYFVARPLNGEPKFIYGHSELPIDLGGQLEASADVVAPDLKSSVQNYATRGKQNVAGAEINGWIVVGECNKQPFLVRASNQTLLEIAQGNPRQSSSLPAMIADYQKATHAR